MWSVEDSSGRTAGWLFGTIHALPDNARWETPAIVRAVSDADRLIVEVRDLDPALLARTLRAIAYDCPCPPIASRLPPTQRGELADMVARSGISAAALDGMETWAVALALARGDNSLDPANGADVAIMQRFAGRPIDELESAESQLAIFDRLPEAAQRAMLAEVIRSAHDEPEAAEKLARSWLRGDLASLEKETRKGLSAHPALYRALFADRNDRWLSQLKEALSGAQRPLIAVGTAHMLGPDGLIAHLEQEGFAIRRIE